MASVDKKGACVPALTTDPWGIGEATFSPSTFAVCEALFAQANGYLGTRGTLEEGMADDILSIEGTYLNGLYLREAIHYDETAFGFASHNNKMLQVPDGKSVTLSVGAETLFFGASDICAFERKLDFKTGLLARRCTWQPKAGGALEISTRRFVSMARPNLLVLEYTVRSDGYTGPLGLTSGLDAAYGSHGSKTDPRAGALSIEKSLEELAAEASPSGDALFLHRIHGSTGLVLTATRQELSLQAQAQAKAVARKGYNGTGYELAIADGETVTLTKFVYYGDGQDAAVLKAHADKALADAVAAGFDGVLGEQRAAFDAFWAHADICVGGQPAVEQGLRFNLFHLFQSAGKDGKRSAGAKGLTGPGYDGHYFWDTEIYIVPFFTFTQPAVARALLEYRVGKLDAARTRAFEMGHDTGALFPWRTIGGEECSSFFPAGSAQYHINAAIAYAVLQYVDATGDNDFLMQGGAELLFETARIWMQLGHFNARRGGQFCIHEVTGPDEYTAMADNNLYTNAMAAHHLAGAARVAGDLAKVAPNEFAALAVRLGLPADEIALWRQAAEKMYLPYDKALGIHEQHDGFLDKPVWDFAGTPADKYPLLLNFHPLKIYRHQVLKQADVVLAQVLLPDQFSKADKRRNLAYYAPITTHDSTLSACIYSVAGAESGNHAQAFELFEETYRMDIENRHANTHYGVHMACMAGSWMAVTFGFAGMRFVGGQLKFNPYLPDGWQDYRFSVQVQGGCLDVAIDAAGATYLLRRGSGITFLHAGNAVSLTGGEALSLPFGLADQN